MYFESQSIFAVRKITNFEQLEGLGEWKAQAKGMVEGARWQFASEGIFSYAPTHGKKNIFPLIGSYTMEENKVYFAGMSTLSVSTSIFSTWCSGKINFSTNFPLMHMDWGNDHSTAEMVTNSLFDSHRRSLYRLTVILQQIL